MHHLQRCDRIYTPDAYLSRMDERTEIGEILNIDGYWVNQRKGGIKPCSIHMEKREALRMARDMVAG